MMRRREFITLIGAAAAWPLAARGQQADKMRRVGFLHDYPEGDAEGRVKVAAFREALKRQGWSDGRNALIDYKSGAVGTDQLRLYAAEMVAHAPDVVLTSGATGTAAMRRASR